MATDSTTYLKNLSAPAMLRTLKTVQVFVDFSVALPAQNDIIQLITCPVNTVVLGMTYEIILASTAAVTISVGKAAGTELSTAFAADATAGTVGVGTNTTLVRGDATGAGGGTDTIDIKVLSAVPLVGKIRFTFFILDDSAMDPNED